MVVSEVRLELLQEALRAAERATDLCSNSLSSAALRATLVINELVENSALISAKVCIRTLCSLSMFLFCFVFQLVLVMIPSLVEGFYNRKLLEQF